MNSRREDEKMDEFSLALGSLQGLVRLLIDAGFGDGMIDRRLRRPVSASAAVTAGTADSAAAAAALDALPVPFPVSKWTGPDSA